MKAKVLDRALSGGRRAALRQGQGGSVFKDLQAKIVRWNILDTGSRIDGRDLKTVRPIVSEVGVLPRAHGSALFTRGETQALVVATLGTGEDEQMIDSLEGTYKVNFMLHYNFPPYSVGEAGRMGSPGRREIGHGKLAWRAIRPILPASHEFPYTMRVVSEITEFERLVLDGDGMRHVAGADGCRRAAQGAGRRHRHGPDQGGASASPSSPTSSATRIISATWTSSRYRHRREACRPAAGRRRARCREYRRGRRLRAVPLPAGRPPPNGPPGRPPAPPRNLPARSVISAVAIGDNPAPPAPGPGPPPDGPPRCPLPICRESVKQTHVRPPNIAGNRPFPQM